MNIEVGSAEGAGERFIGVRFSGEGAAFEATMRIEDAEALSRTIAAEVQRLRPQALIVAPPPAKDLGEALQRVDAAMAAVKQVN